MALRRKFGKSGDEGANPSDSLRKRGGAADRFTDLPDIDLDSLDLDLDEPSKGPDTADAGPASGRRARSGRLDSGRARGTSKGTPLGELLVRNGIFSQEALDQALVSQAREGGLLGQIPVSQKICKETDIAAALGRQYRVSAVDVNGLFIPTEVSGLLTHEQCMRMRVIPFEKLGSTLCVAMANALARSVITEIQEITDLKVKPFAAKWRDIRVAIDEARGDDADHADVP